LASELAELSDRMGSIWVCCVRRGRTAAARYHSRAVRTAGYRPIIDGDSGAGHWCESRLGGRQREFIPQERTTAIAAECAVELGHGRV